MSGIPLGEAPGIWSLFATGALGGGLLGYFGGPFILCDPSTKPPGLRPVRRRVARVRIGGDAGDAGDEALADLLRRRRLGGRRVSRNL